MKILGAILSLLLLFAPLSAGQVFKDVDWDFVNNTMKSMTRDVYQHDDLIVKKSFGRLTLTSVNTQDRFVWLFDTNKNKVYIGSSDDGKYWIMNDLQNIIDKDPEVINIIYTQLGIIEMMVKIINKMEKGK